VLLLFLLLLFSFISNSSYLQSHMVCSSRNMQRYVVHMLFISFYTFLI
jgi:hypothetical protein